MIHLNYFAGAGGFYSLWILLLGSDLDCVFEFEAANKDRSAIFHQNWNIKSLEHWKHSEVWPDNNASKDINFHCNPNAKTWNQQTGTRVVIYTDIDTQFKLATAKKAGVWQPSWRRDNYDRFDDILRVYNNIAADHWPVIDRFEQLNSLDETQKQELASAGLEISNDFEETWKSIKTINWNGIKLYQGYKNSKDIDIDDADLACDLKEIVATCGQCLLGPLGYSTTTECIDFTNHYKKINQGLI